MSNSPLTFPFRSLSVLTLGSVFLICPLLISFDQNAAQGQSKTLFGILDVKVRVFRFVITTEKDGQATLKSLDEGGRDFKIDTFQLDDEKLNFEIKQVRANYESTFDKTAKSYKGKWKQGGGEFDLSFAVVKAVPQDQPQSIWEGELTAAGRKMVLRFRVYDDKAKHSVLMDSPNERVGGFTGTIEKKGDQVTYKIPALRGKLTGQVSADQKTLKGVWNQGIEFPIELKKVSVKEMKKDAAAPKRPQTPKAPFPYTIQNVSIKNPSADLTLAATLTVPKQGDRFPCAILISGSGAQDRDESLMGHKPFWVIADYLSRQGIAVLRFDDRGTNQSTGDHSKATSADFATDVSAIVDFLKTQPKIDATKIGLCGHSEGGLIAPIVAVQRDDIAFIVMMAGPGVNGEKILKNQLKLILKATGAKENEIEFAAALQSQMLDLVKQGKIKESLLDEQAEQLVEKMIEQFPSRKDEQEQILTQAKIGLKTLSTPWMKYFLKYEPSTNLTQVKCPVLAINGTKDTQVDPKLNFPAIEKAFQQGGKKNYRIQLLDNLNHLFQNCKTGALDEYQSIEETFSPEALKLIAEWINQTVQ